MVIALKLILLVALLVATLIAAIQGALYFFTHEYSPHYRAARTAAWRWGIAIALGWLSWIIFVVGW